MSKYLQQIEAAKNTDFGSRRFLTDYEASAYLSLGRTAFRSWAEQIGCRRKIGRRVVNDREVIDAALKRGDAV